MTRSTGDVEVTMVPPYHHSEKEPRITPLGPDEISDEGRRAVEALWKAIGVPPKAEIPEYFTTMLRHPELMIMQAKYATQFMNGALPARLRQLAILRIAWLCQGAFEWSQHVKTAKRLAGLTVDDIERVTIGSGAPEWNTEDKAVLQAVEEMFANATISERTWSTLACFADERQLLELPLLVGYYQSVAYLQNSVRFRLMPGARGLNER